MSVSSFSSIKLQLTLPHPQGRETMPRSMLPSTTCRLVSPSRSHNQGQIQLEWRLAGQAKLLGAVICVGGAILLSFYHGHIINISESKIHWKYIDQVTERDSSSNKNGISISGPMFLFFSSFAWAIWLVIQAKLSKQFPAPYTSTTLICLMASIQCSLIAFSVDCDIFKYLQGVVASALAFSLMSWSIQKKGPLYVSVFRSYTLELL